VTGLLRAELIRAVSRRLVKVGTLLAVAAIVVTAALTALTSHSPTAAQAAETERQRKQFIQECIDGNAGAGGMTQDQAEQVCNQAYPPGSFDSSGNVFHLSGLSAIVQGVSLITIVGGWILGASLVGAEWAAGTITTFLTWEPRRLRVLAGKLFAAMLLVLVLSFVLLSLFAAAMWLVALTRGSTMGVEEGFLRSLGGSILRCSLLSAGAGVLGASIAMIARNAAASMASGFVYLGVVEALIRGFKPSLARWLIGNNGLIVVTGNDPGLDPVSDHVSLAVASITLLGYAAALVVLAGISFRARDVN
jgi:ABC-2 type transport system permease protein